MKEDMVLGELNRVLTNNKNLLKSNPNESECWEEFMTGFISALQLSINIVKDPNFLTKSQQE